MSRHARPRTVYSELEYLLDLGVINAWRDVCDGKRYVVITADGRPHTWTGSQVVAFYAGCCAGRDFERNKPTKAASPIEEAHA